MKVLFVCKGELRYAYPPLARGLRDKHGIHVAAMTFNGPTVDFVGRYGVFDEVINLAAHLKRHYAKYSFEECLAALKELETAEDIPPLFEVFYADRILVRYPYERAIRLLAGMADFWPAMLDSLRPDAIVGEIATAAEWLGSIFARRYGIPYLKPFQTPVGNRLYFLREAAGIWEPMKRAYLHYRDQELPAELRQQALSWLESFERDKTKPTYLLPSLPSPLRPNPKRLLKRLGRIPFRVRTYWQDRFFELGSYHGTHPLWSVWEDTLCLTRHVISEGMHFGHSLPTSKYVYYPLHMQPEFTTDIRAPLCTNQLALIEYIAKQLPIGYRLVVKDHPVMRGRRTLNYYKEISRFKSVELLSPRIDGHDLIRNAAAVVTITGTTAWEAILFQKPIIVFGPLYYGFYDLIYHCPNINEFGSIFREALDHFQPDRELLLKFIASLLETAHEGLIGDSLATEEVISPANLDKMARSIMKECGVGRDELALTAP